MSCALIVPLRILFVQKTSPPSEHAVWRAGPNTRCAGSDHITALLVAVETQASFDALPVKEGTAVEKPKGRHPSPANERASEERYDVDAELCRERPKSRHPTAANLRIALD